jgi:hypothetical protein
MSIASQMLKGFFGSMKTQGDDVVRRATTGELTETQKAAATINVPEKADAVLDQSAPINPARQSDVSFDGRNYNLENITDEDELVRVIDYIGEQNNNFVDARGGGPESFDQTIEKAKKVELRELENIIGYRLGDGVTPQRVAGARILLQESADNLVKMANKIQAGEADVNFQLKFRQAISSHVGIQQAVAGMAADSGRALNAWRIPVGADMGQGSSIYRSQLQQAVDKYGGEKAVNKLAEVILDSKDLTQITKNMQKMHFANSTDMLMEIWINGLLSSPATHAVNTLSNAAVAGLAIPERFMSATVSKLMRTPDGVQYGEVMGQLYGVAAGMRDGFRLAYRAMKDGEVSDPSMKYEARKYNAFSSENINNMGGELFDIKANSSTAKGLDFFGDWVIRLPSRFLGAEDEFFKSVGYRMELNALAYRQASTEGLEGKDFAARVAELIENPTEEIHLGATNASRYQTFTNDLGRSGKDAQKFINNFPPAKIILPFVRTPTNIIKYTAHRTPFNYQMWKDVTAGGVKRDVALARMAMGTGTLLMGFNYALEGKITGRGPENAAARRALRLTGWQPYSIYHNGKYYAYNRLDPVGMFLGLSADTADALRYAESEDASDIAFAAMTAIAKNLKNKSYLDGISNIINAFENPDRYGDAYMGRLLASMIPYTSMVGQVERTLDPTVNEVNTIMDRVWAKTPHFSKDLPPRRNIFGEVITLQGGLGWDFVSPVYTSVNKKDKVADEIVRQEVGINMHSKFYGTSKFRTEYTPEEYDKLVLLTGKEIKDKKGRNLHEALAALIKSEYYNSSRMTNGADGSKAVLIKNLINDYKKAALEMIGKHPDFSDLRTRIEENEIKKRAAFDNNFEIGR